MELAGFVPGKSGQKIDIPISIIERLLDPEQRSEYLNVLYLTQLMISNNPKPKKPTQSQWASGMALLWNFHPESMLNFLSKYGWDNTDTSEMDDMWTFLKQAFVIIREISQNQYIPPMTGETIRIQMEGNVSTPFLELMEKYYFLVNSIPISYYQSFLPEISKYHPALVSEMMDYVLIDPQDVEKVYDLSHKFFLFWYAGLMIVYGKEVTTTSQDIEFQFLSKLWMLYDGMKDKSMEYIREEIEEYFRMEWIAVEHVIEKTVPEKIGSDEMVSFISLLGIRDVLDEREQGRIDSFN